MCVQTLIKIPWKLTNFQDEIVRKRPGLKKIPKTV